MTWAEIAERARARTSDPAPSHAAAATLNRTGRAAHLERQVLLALTRGPQTTKETAEVWGVPRDSHSPRITRLKEQGLVEPTGERRDGAAVLQLTEAGREAVR